MPSSMPQLSPMLGFVMSLSALSFYMILFFSLSKKHSFATKTSLKTESKNSLLFF